MQIRSVGTRFAIPVLAVGLVLTGCSSSEESPPEGAAAALGTASDINPRDVSELRDGGNLRLSLTVLPENWNALQGNYGRIGTPEINALIEQTMAELDPKKADDLANEVDRKLFEIGFSLPLVQSAGNVAVRDNLANYGAPGLASYDYTKIGFLK